MFKNALSQLLVIALFTGLTAVSSQAQSTEIRDAARALGFEPHKALYEIKLAGTRSGSQILNISGQMFYEWQPMCDAWITNHRFNILYEYADSAPMRITSNFSTYEPFDGSNLNFTSQRKRDGNIFEEIRGSASSSEGGMGQAIYTMPSELEFSLPEGTLFPIAHTMGVAQKIRDEKKFYNATIFDGSDEDGPVEVNTFIGKLVSPEQLSEENEALDEALLSSPARNVRLAFFPLMADESASDYEMTLVFHENSLVSDMIIEYDDFSVSQKLIAVEPVADGCHQAEFNE